MDVDRKGNYYNYRGFGHLARNWDLVGQERRMEYRNNINIMNNLKEEESLVVLDWTLVINYMY